jgi:uncharacterized protein YdiU (UPF0061 family)
MNSQDQGALKHTINSELKAHSYLALGEKFYSNTTPTPVAQPRFIRLNNALAEFLNLDIHTLNTPENLKVFSGNATLEHAPSLATVYAGHQFGNWNPQLGDGRALLLGEACGTDNRLYDIQLKGAGPTPYSRMGDGRSPLGPVVREYLVSEAMYALGVPTTRALAAVTTGEPVIRDQLLPGAILTRVAQSHIRIGTFQYFTAHQQQESVQRLADFVIDRHFKTEIDTEFSDNRYFGLLNLVIRRQAQLIAQWMSLGFIHGVMNTDNMLLSGETVDYGPCAFMDNYKSSQVFSSIDQNGRYAFCNQPEIGKWNVSWLAQALLPLVDTDEKKAVQISLRAIEDFDRIYQQEYDRLFSEKIGFSFVCEKTKQLVADLLNIMEKEKLDFTNTFRSLGNLLVESNQSSAQYESAFDTETFKSAASNWIAQWQLLLAEKTIESDTWADDTIAIIRSTNPAYIPRNHQVNQAIDLATHNEDFSKFHTLTELLENPYTYHADFNEFTLPPTAKEAVLRTFCGT